MRHQFTAQSSFFMNNPPDPFETLISHHGRLDVIGIPAFDDNLIWLLQRHDEGSSAPHTVCVVDPGDAAPVIDYCQIHRLLPTQVLLTHHHGDHTGGVAALVTWMRQTHPAYSVTVYGPEVEGIPTVNYPLKGAEQLMLWPDIAVEVMAVPGHTRGHLAYFLPGDADSAPPALFSGDVLFGLGCGRLFEGTAEQMFDALTRIAQLDGATRIYCAHEYTALNLPFALSVDPTNAELIARADLIRALRQDGRATLPLLLSEERATNPFLRCDQTPIVLASGVEDLARPDQVFTQLRKLRDTFKAR